ncbi:MAG: hypothetical protein ACC662_06155 [Planctomycetota bacterium]
MSLSTSVGSPLPGRRPITRGQRGLGILPAFASVILVAGVLAAGTPQVRSLAKGQAHAMAQAGIVDATAGFRRQTRQPVVESANGLGPASRSPGGSTRTAVDEIDVPSTGLVREEGIAPGDWGRYEVRKGAKNTRGTR